MSIRTWFFGATTAAFLIGPLVGIGCNANGDANESATPTADIMHETPTEEMMQETPTADTMHETPTEEQMLNETPTEEQMNETPTP